MILDLIKPFTKSQENLLQVLKDEKLQILGIFGPTGTGKSLFSLAYGIDSVTSSKYKKLVVAKPIVDVVTQEEITRKELGDYEELVKAYIKDVLSGFVEEKVIDDLIDSNKIEIVDSRYLRGRSFNDAIIFIDDIQSMKAESVLELFIRVGKNSKLIVAGDPIFQALSGQDSSAIIREVLLNEKDAKVIDLGVKDIVRSGAKRGLRLLLEYKLRSRKMTDVEKKIYDTALLHAPDASIITVSEFSAEKSKLGITHENVPDALIIVKEGSAGRVIGRNGERINNIEKETSKKVRVVELGLDFKDLIKAVHPVPWIMKHIEDVDFIGNALAVTLKKESGAFMGQKGIHVRFVDYVIRSLFGIGVKVIAPSEEEGESKK
ncbi:PhoH family protein [Sulfolobus tengchongensis]|uniref:PhoH family protein n=1 Tax=Sulfolobus tengchongensis TaxID=207809 RepID=A0AAX4L4C5_9CREN